MIISPSQAILRLIDYYQSNTIIDGHDSNVNILIEIYMNGVKSPLDKQKLTSYLDKHQSDLFAGDSALLSDNEELINNDPTKRYFETQLAYETLKQKSANLSVDRLRYFRNELLRLLEERDVEAHQQILSVISRHRVLKGTHSIYSEYLNYLKRIHDESLFSTGEGFSTDARTKIRLLITCSMLSMRCAQSGRVNALLPIQIYGSGLFADKQRGRVLKQDPDLDQFKAKKRSGKITKNYDIKRLGTQHYGLMKAHMPVPKNDIAMSETVFDFYKSSETANFDKNAEWPRLNFYRLVHPFSNSISGTVLCQLKLLAFLQSYKVYPLTESKQMFDDYFKVLASSITFFSGGHSLFELVYPAQLPEVITKFRDSAKSGINLELEKMTISRLFLDANEQSPFQMALKKTIAYDKQLKIKQQMHQMIRQAPAMSATGSTCFTKLYVSMLLPSSDAISRHLFQLKGHSTYFSAYTKSMLDKIEQFISSGQITEALTWTLQLNNSSPQDLIVMPSYFNYFSYQFLELGQSIERYQCIRTRLHENLLHTMPALSESQISTNLKRDREEIEEGTEEQTSKALKR